MQATRSKCWGFPGVRHVLSGLTAMALLLGGMAASMPASAQYVAVYGGDPATAGDATGLKNAGWSEYILWAGYITASGDLIFNGDGSSSAYALVSNGTYVGNTNWPNLSSHITTMKQGAVKRISLAIYPSSFSTIQTLVSNSGTGPSSPLYKTFAALKANLAVDAIDMDDEGNYNASSVTAFSVMLGNLGYKVSMAPYTNSSYWTSLVSSINSQKPGTVDLIHLQAYDGGASNSPCSGWNFGSVPVIAGDWDQHDSPTFQSKFAGWHAQCNTQGGFLYQYHDNRSGNDYSYAYSNGTAYFAQAIAAGIGQTVPANVPNRIAIWTDSTGYDIYGVGGGRGTGLDGSGWSYSASQLGSSITWGSTTFTLAAPNQLNAWSNTAIPLTNGNYYTLRLLGTATSGNQANQTFTVKYTDGTSASFTQSLSDWFSSSTYSGESVVKTMSYRNKYDGTTNSGTLHLYGYAFAIDGTKTVASVTLPANGNVEVLAYALDSTPPPPPPPSGTQVNLGSFFNRGGIYTDGTKFGSCFVSCSGGGLDNGGYAYSSSLLGPSTMLNGVVFNYGAANTNNDVSAAAQTITLPAGQFSSLKIMGTAVGGPQTAQAFVVTYADGTTATFTQSLSDWYTSQNYAGETRAVQMAYRDTNNGGRDTRIFNLYNYSFALNSTKSVQSIKLPNNANVQILAMTLVP